MREFRKPDLKAPRFRKKRHNIFNHEFFEEFKKKYPEHKELTYSQAQSIIEYSNGLICKGIMENRDGIEFPESLGFSFIGSYKPSVKRDNIDYGKSIKYGMTILNKNWNSDGNIAKIIYTNYPAKYKVKDRQIWSFKPCRTFQRAVSKYYPENYTSYIVIDSRVKISSLYKRDIGLSKFKKLESERDYDDYNEFEI